MIVLASASPVARPLASEEGMKRPDAVGAAVGDAGGGGGAKAKISPV